MQRIDRAIGLALAVFGLAVAWSARSFPAVPGQKLGAGFLPTIVAIGLAICGVALVWRSRDGTRYGHGAGTAAADAGAERGRIGTALVVVAVIAFYVLAADWIGFLFAAPIVLVVAFRALAVGWVPSIAWALAGTVVVHLAFYKLLRVPLPWGVLRPFY